MTRLLLVAAALVAVLAAAVWVRGRHGSWVAMGWWLLGGTIEL